MKELAKRETRRALTEFDRFFCSFFDDFRSSFYFFDLAFEANTLEVKEEKDKYVISGDLSGFRKKDISIKVDDNVLYVQAERRSEDKKTKEISQESFSRVLYLGDSVDTGKIKASFKKNNLLIELTKIKEADKRVKDILIE